MHGVRAEAAGHDSGRRHDSGSDATQDLTVIDDGACRCRKTGPSALTLKVKAQKPARTALGFLRVSLCGIGQIEVPKARFNFGQVLMMLDRPPTLKTLAV